MRAIAVAVPVPGLGSLTYSVPDELPSPAVGARVLVPLGKRTVTGIVLGRVAPASDPNDPGSDPNGTKAVPGDAVSAKPVVEILDAEPFLPPDVVDLASWVAEYYACGVGEAVATAMPPRSWIESERHAAITDAGEARMLIERGARREVLEALSGGRVVSVGALAKKSRGAQAVLAGLEADGLVVMTRPLKGAADASRTVRVAILTAQGSEAIDAGAMKLGSRQLQALDLLRGSPHGVSLADLAAEDISSDSVARLAALGLVTIERQRVDRDPFDTATDGVVRSPVLALTDEQEAALGTSTLR